MKRIIGVSLALAVSAALLVFYPTSKYGVPVVHAQSGCNVATLTGNYGINHPGFVTRSHSVKGTEVPFALVGLVSFDGAGNFSTTATLALKGGISQGLTSSGTYTVNSDCTGSTAFTAGAFSGITDNIVIVGGGAEIFGIVTTPSFTGSFDAKKQ